MFDKFTEQLSNSFGRIRKQARLTEQNIAPSLQEVRLALLEADMTAELVKEFIQTLQEKALGKEVQGSLQPGQVFLGLVHQEITRLLGEEEQPLNMRVQPPAVFMMVGRQGGGKTTNLAKIGLWLKKVRKKKALLVSLDLTRPAAAEQLQTSGTTNRGRLSAAPGGVRRVGTCRRCPSACRTQWV